MSETGMTSMMKCNIIVAMPIANPPRDYKGLPQESLPAGAILMVIDWKEQKPVKHGGIVSEDLNVYQSSNGSKFFVHQDLYVQPWNYIGWHEGVRLDDWLIPLLQEYIEDLRLSEGRIEVSP